MSMKSMVMLLAAGFCAAVGLARATVFHIDEFTVNKIDGAGQATPFFQDTFSNGSAPKNPFDEDPAQVDVNPYDLAYITFPPSGLPEKEAGGKLALDTADGFFNASPVNNRANLQIGARVNSNRFDNAPNALWNDDQFVVSALFDLTIPQLNAERYGIRLTDWSADGRNENIEVTFVRRGNGELRVLFRQADFLANQFTVIQGWMPTLNPNFDDYDQILLSLFNDTSDLSAFSASFTLLDTVGGTNLDPFTRSSAVDNKGALFQVSDWVRPEFFANYTFTIPEPAVLALLGIGLVGIGVTKKRMAT